MLHTLPCIHTLTCFALIYDFIRTLISSTFNTKSFKMRSVHRFHCSSFKVLNNGCHSTKWMEKRLMKNCLENRNVLQPFSFVWPLRNLVMQQIIKWYFAWCIRCFLNCSTGNSWFFIKTHNTENCLVFLFGCISCGVRFQSVFRTSASDMYSLLRHPICIPNYNQSRRF